MSTLEVARQLGMAVRSVQLMVDRGELEAWRTPGGHRRISRRSVQEWLSRRASREPASPLARAAAERPVRLLYIEDSRHFQTLVSLLLKQRFPQLQVQMADDGIGGLAMAGQFQPDILLVDILLPGIDGATLINGLRSQPAFANCQLIVLTSLEKEALAPYEFALQGLPVVHKPRLVLELPALIEACLAARAQAPA